MYPHNLGSRLLKDSHILLRNRGTARQAVSVGKGTVLLLGNETAFQQAGTTQPNSSELRHGEQPGAGQWAFVKFTPFSASASMFGVS